MDGLGEQDNDSIAIEEFKTRHRIDMPALMEGDAVVAGYLEWRQALIDAQESLPKGTPQFPRPENVTEMYTRYNKAIMAINQTMQDVRRRATDIYKINGTFTSTDAYDVLDKMQYKDHIEPFGDENLGEGIEFSPENVHYIKELLTHLNLIGTDANDFTIKDFMQYATPIASTHLVQRVIEREHGQIKVNLNTKTGAAYIDYVGFKKSRTYQPSVRENRELAARTIYALGLGIGQPAFNRPVQDPLRGADFVKEKINPFPVSLTKKA